MRARRALALWAAAAALAVSARANPMEEGLNLKARGKLPEAAAAFERAVAAEPRNPEALAQLATVDGWLGRYGSALQTWRRALKLQPGNGDYRLGLARVLYWTKDYAAALQSTERVLADAPQSVEALTLRGDVLLAADRPDEARAAYEHARALAPEDTELAKKLSRAVSPPHWRVDAGFISDNYTNFRRAERQAYGQLGRLLGRSDVVWARYEWLNEFSVVDTTLQLGGAWKAAPHLVLSGAAAGTPHADFRPKSQADLGAESPWGDWTPTLAYRAMSYQNGTIHVLTAGTRWQAAPWVGLVGQLGTSFNLDRSTTKVVSARADFSWGDVVAPYLGFANGQEALPPQKRATVSYYSAGVVWNATPAFSLRADFTHEDRHDFYQHNAIGGGTSLKF